MVIETLICLMQKVESLSAPLQECHLNPRLTHSREHTLIMAALPDLGHICLSVPIVLSTSLSTAL